MCLAVPMKVVEIDESTATCEVDGVRRQGSLMMLEDVAVGDYVLLHAGFAIERIDPQEAEKTLEVLREALDAGLAPE